MIQISLYDCLSRARVRKLAKAEEAKTKAQSHSRELKNLDDGKSSALLNAERTKLLRMLDKYRSMQASVMGDRVDILHPDEADARDAAPEGEPLGLPSDYDNEAARVRENVQVFVEHEKRLRLGHCYDLLASIRELIKHRAAFINFKITQGHGISHNRKSNDIVELASKQLHEAVERYNDTFLKMKKLCSDKEIVKKIVEKRSETKPGGREKRKDTKDTVQKVEVVTCLGLRKIAPSDVTSRNQREIRVLGDSRYHGSWIFTEIIPTGVSKEDMAAWSAEGKFTFTFSLSKQELMDILLASRVEWFRARADKHRHDENVNRVHSDFECTIIGYEAFSILWGAAGEITHSTSPDGSSLEWSRGKRAFAKQQSAMWMEMCQRCKINFQDARKGKTDTMKGPDYRLPPDWMPPDSMLPPSEEIQALFETED